MNINWMPYASVCFVCRMGRSIVSSSEISGLKVLAIRFDKEKGERLCEQCSAAFCRRARCSAVQHFAGGRDSQESAMINDASSDNIIRRLCVSSSRSLRVIAHKSNDFVLGCDGSHYHQRFCLQASLPMLAPLNLQALSWKSCPRSCLSGSYP